MKIICLEGPTGAGKSTLALRLSNTWHYNLCPTIDYFLNGFPICEKENQVEENFNIYLNAEINAIEYMRSQKGCWIQDRNWLSQLTFLIAIENTCNKSYSFLKEKLYEKILLNKILLPDCYIFLRCSPTLTALRRLKRKSSLWGDVPPWIPKTNKEFFRTNRYNAYLKIIENILKETMTIDAGTIDKNILPKNLLKPTFFTKRFNKKRLIHFLQYGY